MESSRINKFECLFRREDLGDIPKPAFLAGSILCHKRTLRIPPFLTLITTRQISDLPVRKIGLQSLRFQLANIGERKILPDITSHNQILEFLLQFEKYP